MDERGWRSGQKCAFISCGQMWEWLHEIFAPEEDVKQKKTSTHSGGSTWDPSASLDLSHFRPLPNHTTTHHYYYPSHITSQAFWSGIYYTGQIFGVTWGYLLKTYTLKLLHWKFWAGAQEPLFLLRIPGQCTIGEA